MRNRLNNSVCIYIFFCFLNCKNIWEVVVFFYFFNFVFFYQIRTI